MEKLGIHWKPEIKNISELKHWAKNPRTISEVAYAKLRDKIQSEGMHQVLTINTDNVVLSGNQRLDILRELNIEQVYCMIPERVLTLDEEDKIGLASNISDGIWDNALLLKNFEVPLLVDMGFNDLKVPRLSFTDEDDVPEIKTEPISKMGDLYELGRHKVLVGDSTQPEAVLRLMGDIKADMVFCDPPYGVNYSSKNKFLNLQDKGNCIQEDMENDTMTLNETSDFIYKLFCQIKNVLADRSSYYITAPQGGDLMMMMMMMKAGIPLRHCLIWVKNNHVLGRTDYNYKHEPILYGWNKVHDFYGKGEHRFSTWEIPKPHKNDLHPTMKPVALIENAILNSTLENQIVVDLCLGSFSTGIACEKTNRICYGMEIDCHYADVIVSRWCNYTGNKKIKRNGEEIEWLIQE